MIELFILLFVLQGDNSSEWLESCNTDFKNYQEQLSERNPDVLFCKYVKELDLNVEDIEKLGKEFDWLNYTMKTSKEFVDDWGFYQDHAISDTLLIYPSISMRDSLPPGMKVQISFDYIDDSEIKTFDESFKILIKPFEGILSEDEWIIAPSRESAIRTNPYEFDESICDPEVDCLENAPSLSIDGISFTEFFGYNLHLILPAIIVLVIIIVIIYYLKKIRKI